MATNLSIFLFLNGSIINDNQKTSLRPLIFGEVLYDCFPDGRCVPGGAPFNVAWNLRGLGADPLLISAVGDDAEGRRLRQSLCRWGLDTGAVQIVEDLPTGKVDVVFENDEPMYEILDNQAYDSIPADSGELDETNVSLIYHGSLAFRHQINRRTIAKLRSQLDAPVFVDLNLRPPWFNQRQVAELLDGVDWLKVNLDELSILSGCSLPVDSLAENEIADAVGRLRSQHSIRNVFVTAGARGACSIDEHGHQVAVSAVRFNDAFVDSVGAGDAFAAASIRGIAENLCPRELLERATNFAAGVCRMRGATTDDINFYCSYRQNPA